MNLFGEEVSVPISQVPPSLLQSTLQKAVRRGNVELAVLCAAGMWATDKGRVKLVRRLPIIVLEDVVLTPDYDKLVDVMIRASRKSYKPTSEDLNFILQTAAKLAACEWVDGDGWEKLLWNEELGTFDERLMMKLEGRELALVQALLKRKAYGGMKGDLDRQELAARVWTKRFLEGRGWKILDDVWGHVNPDVPEPRLVVKEDLLSFPYGVDMHCSPVVRILHKKVIEKYGRTYDTMELTYKVLDEIVWQEDSGLNMKKMIQTGRPYRYPPILTDQRRFWQEIEPLYRRLQAWWIQKQVPY